jgi:DNA-binding GntR family transcriptional regulator
MQGTEAMTALVPSTKTEFVYQTIRKEILDGQLKPGQRLRLTELASRYDISEMPVREALRKLQHDGLVEFENHRGATVSDLGLERIVEIIATRTYLEILAMMEAMPNHTPDTIAELDDLIARMKKTRNPRTYSELNHRFHQLLAEPCRNAFLKAEIESLWNKVWRTRSESIFQLVPERLSEATQEHQEIVHALKSQSAARVQRVAMQHRERTLRSWRSLATERREHESTGRSDRAENIAKTS